MAEKTFRHLVRIMNTDIDGNKPLYMGLTKIKGIGFNLANAIITISKIKKDMKVGDMTESDVKKIEEVITNPEKVPVWMYNRKKDPETGEDKHILTSDINFTVDNDKKRLMKIKSYKGLRHNARLPVRGQRTKSNFRRNKGKVQGVKKKKK